MSSSSSSSTTPINNMGSNHNSEGGPIYFGPFEVTSQVFLQTPHSFALVNLKPLLPGHVLVCPRIPHRRLTSLSQPELTDLWTTVQRVQRMLAHHYFSSSSSSSATSKSSSLSEKEDQEDQEDEIEKGGSFNLALQDGPESGQTVPHVHVHVIPRIRGSTAKSVETPSDELYERMAGEDGNVGGALWDRDHLGHDHADNHHHQQQQQQQRQAPPPPPPQRQEQPQQRRQEQQPQRQQEQPQQKRQEQQLLLQNLQQQHYDMQKRPKAGGSFPSIEDAQRKARGMHEMEEEARVYKAVLSLLEGNKEGLRSRS